MIELRDTDLMAEGNGRRVFRWPGRDDVVIKIHKPLAAKPLAGLRRALRYHLRRFGALVTTTVEVDEIVAMVARTGEVPHFISQFRGFVGTTLGVGAVFDAVRGADGLPAPHLKAQAWAKGHEPEIERAIDALWDNIERFRCVVSDPNLTNVLVTGTAGKGYHLHLVDGLGERSVLKPLRLSDRAFARFVTKGREDMKAVYAMRVSEGAVQSSV